MIGLLYMNHLSAVPIHEMCEIQKIATQSLPLSLLVVATILHYAVTQVHQEISLVNDR